jgi:hypothetical protein
MKLPDKKKPGDVIKASDWNALIDALAARTPRSGTGLAMSESSGGFAYSLPTPLGQLPKGQPPFSVIAIEKSGNSYLVTIKEGWVIERQPKTASHPHVKFHMPEYDGDPIDTIPRIRLTMAVNDIAWCRYKTDDRGIVTSEKPTIEIEPDDQNGAHYWPPDPAGSGGDGDYYVKLFKLTLADGSPYITPYQQSDIEHSAQLWFGQNTGSGGGIFKEHDEATNTFKFRSVRGDYGIVEHQDADEVSLDFHAENKGAGAPVYVLPLLNGQPDPNPPDGPAQFRGIAARASNPQVHVACTPVAGVLPDTITVEGNGVVGAIQCINEDTSTTTLVAWDDGLMTTHGNVMLKVQEFMVCISGTPTAVKFLVLD